MRSTFIFACIFISYLLNAQSVELVPVSTSFNDPTAIESVGDPRMFVVEREGFIHILYDNGMVEPQPFLDITDRVNSTSGEQGLLGMAFHPQYAINGYFYVNYIYGAGTGNTRISRFSVTADPNVAEPSSEVIIWTTPQPGPAHNGGDLAFGPDGYLWFALGDGGEDENAQDMTSPLGKMIRIDVDGASPYAIPANNPFAGSDPLTVLPEIWASGLRNPFRFSFDPLNGDIYIADVGQLDYEEVNYVAANDHSGANFGWRCYEGPAAYNTDGCAAPSAYDQPIHYHHHTDGSCSIIGGFVYRGSGIPAIYGKYIYTDFCHGRLHALTPDGSGGWTAEQLTVSNGLGAASFGVDMNGELWLVYTTTGVIYRLVAPEPVGQVFMDVKVFLEGPLDAAAGSMHDDLRSAGFIPLVEPYTAMGAVQVGGGGETTNATVLAVTGDQAVVDWIRLELRHAIDPDLLVATRQALVLRNGDVVMADGSTPISFEAPEAEHFLVVGHRNHLSVMTASTIPLNATPVLVDLRSPATAVYGTAARKPMGTFMAMWAGDASADGLLKYTGDNNDRDLVLLTIGGISPTMTTSGYYSTDINMDGIVRYTGADNDRDPILVNIGGVVPTQIKAQQIP